MSEFTKFTKALSDLEKELQNLNDIDYLHMDQTQFGPFEERVAIFAGELSSIHSISSKFATKKSQRDEVTGVLRYGPSMCAKIDAACHLAEELKQKGEELVGCIFLHKQKMFQSEMISAEQIVPGHENLLAVSESAVAAVHDLQLLQKEANYQKELQFQEALRAEQELLHQKAEEIRIQKYLKIDDFRDQLRQIIKFMQNTPRAVGNLLEKMKEMEVLDRQMLQCIIQILERIIHHPDNNNLRRIRIDHPAIWEPLTSKKYGILLLLNLGFEIRIEGMNLSLRADGSPFSGTSDTTNSVVASSDYGSVSTVVEPNDIIRIAQESVGVHELVGEMKIMFVLVEPDPGDSMKWIQWFDLLSSNKDMIAAALAKAI